MFKLYRLKEDLIGLAWLLWILGDSHIIWTGPIRFPYASILWPVIGMIARDVLYADPRQMTGVGDELDRLIDRNERERGRRIR